MTTFPYEKLLLHLRVASLIGNYGQKHGTHKRKSHTGSEATQLLKC